MPILERQNAVSEHDVDHSLNDDIRSHDQRHIIESSENNNGARHPTANDLDIRLCDLESNVLRFQRRLARSLHK
ncbi:MAG: hypothetical protein MUQ51_06175 [Pseudomonadota bacterium]|nr:hypothetical protein [Pseudomonadota bacterium]